MGIPKGFPKSVGSAGSRLHGFPRFPHSVIYMACFPPGNARQTASLPSAMRCNSLETFIVDPLSMSALSIMRQVKRSPFIQIDPRHRSRGATSLCFRLPGWIIQCCLAQQRPGIRSV